MDVRIYCCTATSVFAEGPDTQIDVANNLGYAYQQAGRLAQAKLAYQQAIELDPDYWKARINLDALESAQPR